MRTRLRPSSTRFSLPDRVPAQRTLSEQECGEPAAVSGVTGGTVAVIVVAAGSGIRLGAGKPKAFASLCGESLLAHALRGVFGCVHVEHVIIVAPPACIQQCRSVAGDDPRVDVVAGGVDRSASVQAGLAALGRHDGIVLVHDVARCLAPPELFARVISSVRGGHPAVVPGLAVTDTVKVVDAQGRVLQTPQRECLRTIQTPQGFMREVLERAYASGMSATDDAGLVERSGGQVRVVEGDSRALKITSPIDLTLATALLQDSGHVR
jgi:2-C-methyl-D-erythritol 4-phosphate cytidylyltransferase